jgi:pimeloyl-ACP methyl ester carboxylesterase
MPKRRNRGESPKTPLVVLQFAGVRLYARQPVRPATFRDIKSSGIRLRVTEVGEGPPVLLLHTALLDRTSWSPTIEQLSSSFRVVAPDLPGFGESEKPTARRFGYTLSEFTHVVTDLFAALELGKAHVIGHGLGGAISIALASRNPELVSRLVLADALCYPTPPDVARRIASIPVLGGLLFKQVSGRGMFGSYFRNVLSSGQTELAPERVQHYFEVFSSPSARSSALQTLRATQDSRPVVAQLRRISAPTLVVWGRRDGVYPAAFGQRLARDIRGAGFMLLDTGHIPQEEAPEEFAQGSKRFLLAERP